MADIPGSPRTRDDCITYNDKYPKYKGVRKRKWGKWVSEVRLPNSRERIWLGSFDSPEKAARAFDAAQFCLRGRCARFNFPDDPPDIPGGDSLGPHEIQAVAARFANEIGADHRRQRHEEENDGRETNPNMVTTNENSSYSSSLEQSQSPNCYDNRVTDVSLFDCLNESANNYDSFDQLYDNQMHYLGPDEFYNPAVLAQQDTDYSAREDHYALNNNGDESIPQQQYSSFLWNF